MQCAIAFSLRQAARVEIVMTILTHALTSWPIEDYHEVRDRGKTWVALDGLLFMALQDTIDRTQRGNRLEPLLL